MFESFWVPLAVLIIGTFAVWYLQRAIKFSRRHSEEKKIIRYLTNNTEDHAGKQFLLITDVASKTGLSSDTIRRATERCPKIFFCPSDQNKIGLFAKERSVYEERGVISL